MLLHHPCEFSALDAALWEGLEEALARNLTRAIGVSNYGADDLAALEKAWTVPPAVNQCEMSVGNRDAAGLNATRARGVTYEAYEAMRGCPPSQLPATAHDERERTMWHSRMRPSRYSPAGNEQHAQAISNDIHRDQ